MFKDRMTDERDSCFLVTGTGNCAHKTITIVLVFDWEIAENEILDFVMNP